MLKVMFGCMNGIFQKYVYTAEKYEKEATAITTLQFGGACLLTGLQEHAAFQEISEDASFQCGVSLGLLCSPKVLEGHTIEEEQVEE